jgi:hypothetical protein
MSKRLDPSWIVIESIENPQHDRCVDLFMRPDGSFGFEEFRRGAEDAGQAATWMTAIRPRRWSGSEERLSAASGMIHWTIPSDWQEDGRSAALTLI